MSSEKPRTLGDVASGKYVNVFGEQRPIPEAMIRIPMRDKRIAKRPLNHVLIKLLPSMSSAIGKMCWQTGLKRRTLIKAMIAYCLNHREAIDEIMGSSEWRNKV